MKPQTMKPIGILGGGQLARMLALKAHEMGLAVRILSERADDPAAQIAPWTQGRLQDRATLKSFLKQCHLVTFESEFLDADLLVELAHETGIDVLPRPGDMALIQDRLTQKQLLFDHDLPTARFFEVATAADAESAFRALGGAAVFKKRRFGYDGYGTYVVRSAQQLRRFLPELEKNPHGFIAEEWIRFDRELAVMVARSVNGAITCLPFVETHQENSRCLWVKGPLKEKAALSALSRQLRSFVKKIGYCGILGVELFETRRKGAEILINELAPRVHNSAHYSLDALSMDQFTLHLKAILGEDLGSAPVPLAKGFAMMNLLGGGTKEPSWVSPADAHVHWYGKRENRPGRKMGHLNALAISADAALRLLRKRRADFQL